jgi:transposase
MAHSAKKKAEVINAVVAKGLSYEDAKTKYGVGKATIAGWIADQKTEQKTERKPNNQDLNGTRQVTPQERQKAEFDQKLINLLGSSLDMLEAWANQCKDPDFIKRNPEGVNELGRTVLER